MGNTKKKPSFSRAILNLVVLVPTVFGLLQKVVALLEVEARLAGRSFIQLIVLSMVFGSLLTATWVGVLAMLYLYFQSLLWTPLLSLFMLFIINVAMLIIVTLCLCKAKKNLFFPEVRSHFRSFHRLLKK